MARRILIVEDDPGYQELMTLLLKDCDVTVCPSSELGQRILKFDSFDLIITDLNLLGKSGFELISAAAREGTAGKAPFIVCTSMLDEEVRRRAAEVGAAGFLTKPFEPQQLLTMVQSLIAHD
jgi:two-component system chemotaxis response regulator CheY